MCMFSRTVPDWFWSFPVGTISAKVEKEGEDAYDDFGEFEDDLNLIWDNCHLFNQPGSYMWVVSLGWAGKIRMRSLLLDIKWLQKCVRIVKASVRLVSLLAIGKNEKCKNFPTAECNSLGSGVTRQKESSRRVGAQVWQSAISHLEGRLRLRGNTPLPQQKSPLHWTRRP